MDTRFKGTAFFYDRFRTKYLPEFFAAIAESYHLDATGHLLDLGCGTGQLAIPLAPHFERVTGMDPEPEMLEFAQRRSMALGQSNISWVLGDSETLMASGQCDFRVVTMAQSFHWMDRDRMLDFLHGGLKAGSGVVIAGEFNVPPEAPFNQVVAEVMKRWTPQKAGDGKPKERHETVIARSKFKRWELRKFSGTRQWTVEDVIGHCYSLSICSIPVLGGNKDPFEKDLREELLKLDSSKDFSQEIEVQAFFLYRDP